MSRRDDEIWRRRPVYLVDGARTPFLKAAGGPGPFSAGDLAVQAGRTLLLRQPFLPEALDEVILGCAAPSPDEVNIGRVAALRLGCGDRVTGWTVMRNCASGLQAIDSALANIQSGRSELVLAGGVDALSRAPLLFSEEMARWLARGYAAKTIRQRLALVGDFRLRYLSPVIGLVKGLTDPMIGWTMGQTAENLAHRFSIDRQAMDAYAAESNRRVLVAHAAGHFAEEIVPLIDARGTVYTHDDGARADASPEKLARLRPAFDPPHGNITAGNSSQITDGAAWVLLASEPAVQRFGLRPLGRIVDLAWAGLSPAEMGLGPVHAATEILRRQGVGASDVDVWEINEAFAAQVLACLAAWQSPDFCRAELGLPAAFGQIDPARLNVDGGAIALGHPVGASGARIVLHALNVLRRRDGRRAIAALCIGGGLGGAVLLERT